MSELLKTLYAYNYAKNKKDKEKALASLLDQNGNVIKDSLVIISEDDKEYIDLNAMEGR